MDEFIIKSQGYSDEIISANSTISAKRKYLQRYPDREITEVIYNNAF